MPRHVFTREECRRGGLTRSKQPNFREAGQKGFEATMRLHPFYARKWLKKKIGHYNRARAVRSLVKGFGRAPGRRRPGNAGQGYF
jgi:transposase